MLKKLYKLFKALIVSIFLIYAFNLIAAPIDLIIPINLITILLVCIFGVPAILALTVLTIVLF